MDADAQHILIVGGSSGIGRALARLMVGRGAHVSIIARRQALLDETLAELESLRKNPAQRLKTQAADVTQWEQAQQAIALLTDGLPADILVNSAGYIHPGYVEQLSLDNFRTTMDVDFFGALHATKAVLPQMIERRRGHIVNISSIAGFMGVFGYTAYNAAKFAVRGFSEALRMEMKPYGIHVSIVFPPDTETPGLDYERLHRPLETTRVAGTAKAMSADHVARAIVRGIERKQVYILPGFDARAAFFLCNGLLPIFNRYFDHVVAKARRESASRSPHPTAR